MGEEQPRQGSTVLRLRGLPYSATDEDLREFFSDYQLVHTHICRRNGRATGEAYAQFSSVAEAENALKGKNCQHMGHRYVEIFEALEADIGALQNESGPDSKLKGFVVRLRGLPFSATADDIVTFFEGIEISGGQQGIVFSFTPDGRPLGEAYVEFPTEAAQKEALSRHKAKIGARYIELFTSTKGDMFQAIQQNGYYQNQNDRKRGPQQRDSPAPGADLPTDGSTLKLRGLPYSAGVDEITEFFSGFSLASDGVQLQTKPDRNGGTTGTGVAYVQFESPEEADKARENRHRATLGSRYIECLPYTPAKPYSGGNQGAQGGQGGGQGGPPPPPPPGKPAQSQAAKPPQAMYMQQPPPPPAKPPGQTNGRAPGKPQPSPPIQRGVVPPGPPGQHMMTPHDYNAQQQLMMQQHYLMQQHMMQQQQALRGYGHGHEHHQGQMGWGGLGASMVPQHQQGNPVVGAPWFKGFGNPGQPGLGGPGLGPTVGTFSQQGPGSGYGYGMQHGGQHGQHGHVDSATSPSGPAQATSPSSGAVTSPAAVGAPSPPGVPAGGSELFEGPNDSPSATTPTA